MKIVYPVISVICFTLATCLAAVPLNAEPEAPRTVDAALEDLTQCLQGQQRALAETGSLAEGNDEAALQAATQRRLKNGQVDRAIVYTRQVAMQLDQGQFSHAAEMTMRMLREFPLLDECGPKIQALHTIIEKQQEEQVRETLERFKSFKAHIGEKLLDASAASDLDEAFLELTALESSLGNHRDLHTARSELQRVTNIVSNWQDFLAYRDVGNGSQAQNRLQQISRLVTNTPIVPRSQVMALEFELQGQSIRNETGQDGPAQIESPAEIMAKVDSIEDVPEAKRSLEALSGHQKFGRDADVHLGIIADIEAASMMMERGDPLLGLKLVQGIPNRGGAEWMWAQNLKQTLKSKAIFLAVPKAYRPSTMPESTQILIETAASAMDEKQDWGALWTFLSILQDQYRGEIPFVSEDLSAVEDYIYATRLENTGQLDSALNHYNQVIRKSGKHGPYSEALEAIKRIQGPKAKALLADQKRKAEEPVPPIDLNDPRFRYSMGRSYIETQRMERMIEQSIEKKFAAYLSGKSKAEAKTIQAEEGDKASTESKEPAEAVKSE